MLVHCWNEDVEMIAYFEVLACFAQDAIASSGKRLWLCVGRGDRSTEP